MRTSHGTASKEWGNTYPKGGVFFLKLPRKQVLQKELRCSLLRLPKRSRSELAVSDLYVFRTVEKTKFKGLTGLWLESQAENKLPKGPGHRLWWWLPPVIWPEDEKNFKELVSRVLKKGARNFVLNAQFRAQRSLATGFFQHAQKTKPLGRAVLQYRQPIGRKNTGIAGF
ncbi:MAG: hypothetical protein JRC55_03795 [Deltaproteobacteria bacterium]|nr:hypothetical protein [Deltaproteobacteria bacterium]